MSTSREKQPKRSKVPTLPRIAAPSLPYRPRDPKRYRPGIGLIGCGGITDGASAQEKVAAGAKLVQIYTGLIYRGPSLLRQIGEVFARKKRVG